MRPSRTSSDPDSMTMGMVVGKTAAEMSAEWRQTRVQKSPR
jgi:hypothetical protein